LIDLEFTIGGLRVFLRLDGKEFYVDLSAGAIRSSRTHSFAF